MFFLSKEFIHLAAEGKYIFKVSQAFQVISGPFATRIPSFSFSSPSICHIPAPLKSGITKGKERRNILLSPHVRAVRNCVCKIGSRVSVWSPFLLEQSAGMKQTFIKLKVCNSGRNSPFQSFRDCAPKKQSPHLYPDVGEKSLSLLESFLLTPMGSFDLNRLPQGLNQGPGGKNPDMEKSFPPD